MAPIATPQGDVERAWREDPDDASAHVAHPETPRQRLAVLGGGFAVAVATLALFAALAEDVATRESIALDNRANAALHQFATPTLDTVMHAASLVGSALVLGPLLLLAVIALLVAHRRRPAAFLAIAAVGGTVLNEVLKLAFHRARPGLPWAATLQSYSFPSGHAMSSFICYLALALVVWRVRGRRWGIAAVACASLLVLLIGVSRIYLGVHYLSDVVGGYAAGACWVSGAATATAEWRRRRAR